MRLDQRRRGSGLFMAMACSAIVCLSIIAVSRLFSTASTLDRAARAAGGAVAEQAALSAVEEGLWHFQQQLGDQQSRLFKRVRLAIVRCGNGEDGCRLDCSAECQPEQLLALRGQPLDEVGANGTLSLDDFQLLWYLPRMERDEDTRWPAVVEGAEKGQTIEISATVSVAIAGRRVRRSAKARHAWGVSHISEPKPYDQLPMAVVRAGAYSQMLPTIGFLLDLAEEYNCLSQRFNGFVDYLETFPHGLGGVEERMLTPFFMTVGIAPATDEPEQAAIEAVYRRDGWRLREWQRLTEQGRHRDEGLEWRNRRLLDRMAAGQLHFRLKKEMNFNFALRTKTVVHNRTLRETAGVDSVTIGLETSISMAEYDVNARLADDLWQHWDELLRVSCLLRDLMIQWRTRTRRDVENNDVQSENDMLTFVRESYDLLAAAEREIKACIEAVNRFNRWAMAHTVAPFASPAELGVANYQPLGYHLNQRTVKEDLAAVAKRFGGVNGHVFIAPLPGLAANSEAATAGKSEDGTTVSESDVEAAAEALAAAIEGEHPSFEPVHCALKGWRGQTVVSAFRPVWLHGVSVADESRDLLVFGLQKAIFTNGTVTAGVTCAEARFEGAPRVHGNVVIGSLPFKRQPERIERFAGTVDYGDELFSGHLYDDGMRDSEEDWVVLENYTVGVSPRRWSREVSRKVSRW